jgi:alpha-glucoside transport system substrate-binding protein
MALLLVSAACGSVDASDPGSGSNPAADTTEPSAGIDCSLFEQFGDISGTQVSVYSTVEFPPLYDEYGRAWQAFEQCTGADVAHEASGAFSGDIIVRAESGDVPDIALFPQPGLLAEVVGIGAVKPVFDEAKALVAAGFTDDWTQYGTFGETLYGFPHGRVSSKSLVWYAPAVFGDAAYDVPQTWEEMLALSDRIAADNPGGRVKPWCAGIADEDATGWPATDWVEDVMIRAHGSAYYDDWVSHDVPFNEAESLQVWQKVGSILRNPDFVNGGFGDVASIATTSLWDPGAAILDGECHLMKMASFQQIVWPQGVSVAPDGDVFAFYFPIDAGATERPVVVGADYVAAMQDRPEVRAFLTFLASSGYHNIRDEEAFGFVSPHLGASIETVSTPLGRLVFEQLRHPDAVVRFDGSDLMPGAVGAGSFWQEATAWIAEGKPTQSVLDAIEASWPR